MQQLPNNDMLCHTVIQNEKDKDIPISNKDGMMILVSTSIISLLYAVCFNGEYILPQISFTIFSLCTFGIITIMLKTLGYYKNTKALFTVIPISVLSLMNGIFDINLFSYSNVLMMNVLFAIYIIWVMKNNKIELFSTTMVKHIEKTILGNCFVFVKVFKKIPTTQVDQNKVNWTKKVLIGTAISLPILFALVTLLSSADMVFNRLLNDFFSNIFELDLFNLSFIITFIIVWIYTIGYVVQAKINNDDGLKPMNIRNMNVDIVIGGTVLVLINLLFLVFSIIQIAFLFSGGFMKLPDEMVYSQYAREGFFQLLIVTIINFSVIVTFVSILKGSTKNKLLRFLLLMLCLFTSVLIASSFYRMYLYTDVYGYTVLRLCVLTFLVMEVFLICITISKLFNNSFAFGKWFISICFVFYFIVNITGSDYFATRLNIARYLNGEQETMDVTFTGTDGLYLIKNFKEKGQSITLSRTKYETEYYSRNEDGNISLQENFQLKTFEEWQNWSYFKRKGFIK